ncbi:MAG: pyridoxamine 5'-phosphate oxidase family protein [Clostridia bacterium]|nr:pyridoxamine 5'-phosphate oxidase family protein [Clostridia bacterium]
MFREMRRFRQKLTEKECEAILLKGADGVLALIGDEGYPYTVPLNYVYKDGALYFHCAKEGHKIDAIKNCDKASFCIVDKNDIVQEKYTTFFRSVVVFGRMSEVDDDKEKFDSVKALTEKLCPDFKAGIEDEINKDWNRLNLLKMTVEHMSGKQAIELVKKG